MVRLILVRHAESEMNQLGIHQGQLHDTGLSPTGIEQAKSLAKKLKFKDITEIYSSDMKRAIETAEIIDKEVGKIEIKTDRRLREFTMGDFDNFPEKRDSLFKIFYDQELAKNKSKYEIRPPNGENIWDFIKRITSFLEEIKTKKGTILAVAHGGFNEIVFNLANNLEKDNFRRFYQENACINELIYEEGKWTIVSINETSHLDKTKKPKKEIYPNQEEIKHIILEEVVKILKNAGISKAYLFGSLATGEFGKYSEKYGRHKGSNINILAYLKLEELPQKWKYIDKEEGFWEIYEIGKYELNGTKHKIDVFIIKNQEEQKVKEKIKELGWKTEELICFR